MSLPNNAPVFAYRPDPSDVLDYYLVVSRGEGPECLLRDGEDIASYQLAPSAAAVAAGVELLTGPRGPVREGLNISFWATIAPESRSLAIFDRAGAELGIELTLETTATPARTKQVTVGINWMQK